MAQKEFIDLKTLLAAGLGTVDKEGNIQPTREMLLFLQQSHTKDQAFDLLTQLQPTVPIAGRTEGLGTTVQNVDASGVVTDAGVDLARDYVNKSLKNVPDSNLRRALTPEMTNYIAVASVQTPGQSGIARPTTYFDLGDAGTLVNPQNAYDSDRDTFATIEATTGSRSNPKFEEDVPIPQTGWISLRGFVQPGSPLSAATLRISSVLAAAGATGLVRYSLDAGGVWTNLYALGVNRPLTTDEIVLLVGQDFSKIWVEAQVSSDAQVGDSGVIQFYDARVDYALA